MTIDFTVSSSPSPLKVSLDYLEQPVGIRNLLVKPGIKALEWTGQSPETLKTLSRSNVFFRWLDLPKKIRKFSESFELLRCSKPHTDIFLESGRKLLKAGKAITSTTTSSILLARNKKVFELSEEVMSTIDKIGFASCFVSSIVYLSEVPQVYREYSLEKKYFNYTLLKLISKVVSLISGCSGMVVFYMGGAVAFKTALLGLSTFSLSISIFRYYCKRL